MRAANAALAAQTADLPRWRDLRDAVMIFRLGPVVTLVPRIPIH